MVGSPVRLNQADAAQTGTQDNPSSPSSVRWATLDPHAPQATLTSSKLEQTHNQESFSNQTTGLGDLAVIKRGTSQSKSKNTELCQVEETVA